MKYTLTGFFLAFIAGYAHASFDKYHITDLGMPISHGARDTLLPSQFSNGGIASCWRAITDGYEYHIYQGGTFSEYSPPRTQFGASSIYPVDSNWFGYGYESEGFFGWINAGFYQNGQYFEVKPETGWLRTAVNNTSETKYLAGAEISAAGTDKTWRAMLYNVQTGTKTFLPQIAQNTYVMDAFDDGSAIVTATVNADTFLAHGYLWKNGQYTHLGSWVPRAMSKTGYVAGTWGGFASTGIFMWHDGVNYDFISTPTQQLVTGVSDAGIVSCFKDSYDKPAYLASITGVAKLNDLVVNLPNGMNIYGATINASGHMFGQALVGNEHHFVLLDPVPEPGTWLVVGLGAVVLLRRKRIQCLCHIRTRYNLSLHNRISTVVVIIRFSTRRCCASPSSQSICTVICTPGLSSIWKSCQTVLFIISGSFARIRCRISVIIISKSLRWSAR